MVAAATLLLNTAALCQVSGFIFRDFNNNGIKENTASYNEPSVPGITVRATLVGGSHFNTTTNALGAYSFSAAQIPAGTKARIEFTGLETGDYSSASGLNNGGNVQFKTGPNNAVNFAVNAPDDYWNNTAMPNPALFAINSRRGNTSSFYSGQYTLVQLSNNTIGPSNPADQNTVTADTSKRIAYHYQTGSIYGLAVQSKQERLFAAAILKRASGFGPRGAGGIYIMGKSGATWASAASFTLQGVVPSNGGAALDFGSVTRVTSPASNDNYISDNPTWSVSGGSDARDIDAFAKASTISYGDIEADPASDKIYMINLHQKRLIVFNATATTAALNSASPAALAPLTTAYDITALPGCPAPTGGASNSIRPFAIKIYKGRGYIGMVSDAMGTQNRAHLMGYILQFDPNNIAAGFTTSVTINFNNYRDMWNGRYWRPWVNTWAQTGGTLTTGPGQYPQPIISGIEFNEDGSMDIGIRDRWGDQGAVFEFIPAPGATAHLQTGVMGDLLHACKTASGWAVEGTAGSCNQPVGNLNANTTINEFGYGYSYGNTGREWYADRSGDGIPESNEGGLAKLMGTGNIVSVVYDPMEAGETVGSNYWSTQGIQWNTVATGAKHHIARIQGENSNSMDKANGMGDLEFITQLQPIQIGNRIWHDTNADGIQDAGEDAPVVPAGTTVILQSPGLDGVYNTADDQSWTTTTDANGNYFFSTLSSADNRKPASWTAVGNIILPGYNYRIKVAIPAGYNVTTIDASSNTIDAIDNDAYVRVESSITYAAVDFNTGNTNHNFDIGFMNLTILPADKLELSAQKQQNKVVLNWVTSNENNSSHFVAERSTDGIHFTIAGENIQAGGTTTSLVNYALTDNTAAAFSAELVYYRIKLFDKSGNYKYSNIATIKNEMAEIKVWPNPFTETVYAGYYSKSRAAVTITLTDNTGRIIKTVQQQATVGQQYFAINGLAMLPQGIYIITVTDDTAHTKKSYKLKKE